MVRLLVYIALIFLISAALAWLADRPGEIVMNWQGYEIRTSLMIAAFGIAIVVAAILVLWWAIRAIVRAPQSFETYLGRRRRDRGYKVLSEGMIAVGAGDGRTARKAAQESRTLLGPEPLTLLLEAQSAQLAGDAGAARSAFETLAAQPETRLLGLHGLFIEAQRQDEHEAARHFAEQASEANPRIGWAGEALFEYRSRSGDWLGAMQALEANVRAGVVDKAAAQRQRAALLTARAMEIEAGEPQEARAAALEAHRLAPDLVPAATVASRLLSRAADYRRAARVLETTWRNAPHPDIAEAYSDVRPGDSVRDRLKRMRKLNEIRANHPEGAMALARAAIDARDFDAARGALEGLAKASPSEGVCLLMAEIEEQEHGDQGKVRMWMARAFNAPRDPVWMADGQVFEHWAPVSPVSGHVGVFEWNVPPESPPSRVAMEIEADLAAEEKLMMVPAPAPQIAAKPAEVPEEPAEPVPAVEPEPALSAEPARPAEPAVEAVAPVEPAPPGPAAEPAKPAEPETSAPEVAPEPKVAAPLAPVANGEEKLAGPEAAEASEAKAEDEPEEDGEADHEPRMPRPPDDPGPIPDEEPGEGGRRRRFGLF